MSYCSELKKELCQIKEMGRSEKSAMLYGLFFAGRVHNGRNVIQTENPDVIETARLLAEEVFPKSRHEITRRVRCGSSLYTFAFKSEGEEPFGGCEDIGSAVSGNDSDSGAFLRGVFISCGSLTDPNKGYHLELNMSDNARAALLFSFITEHGIPMKTTKRRRTSSDASIVIYAKESLVIEDFLTYIGAGQYSMEIMQIKVERSVRNRANRGVNCDSANLDKTIEAANRMCSDIELIFAERGRDSLKPELLETALLRLDNRESSLSELCELSDPPLSRSGLNHRLKRLAAIAEEIRNSHK